MHEQRRPPAHSDTLDQLVAIISGTVPMEEAVRILHPDLISHMDPWTFHGIDAWASWVRFIRSRRRVSELGLEVEEVIAQVDGTVVAVGRWTALKDGRWQSSGEVSARYRIEDSKILEIWTKPANYGFILGGFVNHRFSILSLMTRIRIRNFWLAPKTGFDRLAARLRETVHPGSGSSGGRVL